MSDTTDARRIEYTPLSEVVHDPQNPKAHELDLIGDSINRFGYVEPMVLDERTGKLISGHGRAETLAAMELTEMDPPEGVHRDEDGRWLVPLARGWASRSDLEAQAALIALNRTGEAGGWVDDSLLDLLDNLTESGDDGLLGVGFSQEEFRDLQGLLDRVDSFSETGGRELDDLADTWDETSGLKQKDFTIAVSDKDLEERFLSFRDSEGYKDSMEALRGLLDRVEA